MIEVIVAGIQTTIQDRGRFGYRKFGVPVSGAMDTDAMTIANRTLGNTEDKAVLEFLLKGPLVKFHSNSQICISGSGFHPLLNNIEIPLNHPISVKKGDTLKIGNCSYGMYGYLAVSGGVISNPKLGSQSQYYGITVSSKLKSGDQIQIPQSPNFVVKPTAVIKPALSQSKFSLIYVEKGPDFDLLSEEQQETLFSTDFTVSSAINRMGYRLESSTDFSAPEIVTAPVQPGTVQLTPSGNLIALMRDAQTTGGYARILQINPHSLNQLAQKRTGETLQFKLSD